MCVGVGCFMFWQILPSISLYVWFLKGFDLYYIYIILYIYIYIYIVFIIVFIYCITNTKHWTDKWKYIPYIFVTHKVLKSCRIKMATLAHDVCDIYIYIYMCGFMLFSYSSSIVLIKSIPKTSIRSFCGLFQWFLAHFCIHI